MKRDEKGGRGRVKVRFVEFELEGSDQALQNSIREITQAMGRPQVVRVPATRSLPAGTPEPDEEAQDEDLVPADDDDEAEERTSASTGSARRGPPRSPEVLDLNLDSATPTLTAFCTPLPLDSDVKKYAAIAYWFKHFFDTPEVTADHIHTAFRRMGWNTPTDAGAPLRRLKKRKYGYVKSGANPGSYALNHVGDNFINDLRKAAGQA